MTVGLLARLDDWYQHRHKRRLDRGPVYVSVMIAIFCWALSFNITGPVAGSAVSQALDATTQNMMALGALFGSALCLIGITSGSRRFRCHVAARECYKWSIAGMPSLAAGLAVYGGAVFYGSYVSGGSVVALAGLLGPLIALGDAIQGLLLFLETRRINRNIPLVEAIESDDPLEALPVAELPDPADEQEAPG